MWPVMFGRATIASTVRAGLRLRERERAGAGLLALGRPLDREVAVEVEALERRRDLDRHPVVVADRPFPEQSVELAVLRVPRRARAGSSAAARRDAPSRRRSDPCAASSGSARRRRCPPRRGRPARPAADTGARSSGRSADGRPARARRRRGSVAGSRRTRACRGSASPWDRCRSRSGACRSGGAPRVQPVTSSAWMFASIRKAGLSTSAPLSKFVIVASQMSRSSYERPIDSSR